MKAQKTLSEKRGADHYARPWTSEDQRADHLQRWLIHYNYHRAHTATGNQPPATLTPTTVTNVMMQNS